MWLGQPLYKKCINPNKEEFRQKRVKEIAEAKGKTQTSQLRSYFLQMEEVPSDDKTEANENDSAENSDENVDDALSEYRTIVDALDGNLDERMFLESQEDAVAYTEEKATCEEWLNTATRHAFFGSTQTKFGAMMTPKGTSKDLRNPPNHFPGIMIDNGSTGSLCSVAQLEAYRKFTRKPNACPQAQEPLRHLCPCGSKYISVATFKFRYGSLIISLDAPIVENSDTPLTLGLSDQDRLGSRGADKLNKTIAFHDCPEIPLIRENNHL